MGVSTTAMATAAKVKLASLILAGTLVVGGAGATGATVAASNGAFGQQVKQQVQTCKADLASGAHGIGKCVSTFAKDHGQDKREQHSHGNGASSDSHGQSSDSHGKSSDSHGASSSAGGASNSSHGASSNAGAATTHP
ncbi:MAG TPA: hypothetical protein VF739_11955 [Ktedonobacterales bacterium]